MSIAGTTRTMIPATTQAVHKPPIPVLTVDGIEKRTQRALQIGSILHHLAPGQKLANGSEYVSRITLLNKLAIKDQALLSSKGIKASPAVEKAREALYRNRDVIDKVMALARIKGIIPNLHDAVRGHDVEMAGLIRAQDRRLRLGKLVELYAKKSEKNKVIAPILAKPGAQMKLLDALEIFHSLNYLDPISQKSRFTDPDMIQIFKDPTFNELVSHPEAQMILNGQDVLSDVDAQGISPLEEAIMQKDPAMVDRLLFAHHHEHLEAGRSFQTHLQTVKREIAARRNIDINSLDEVSKAAYLGNIQYLEMVSDFNQGDKSGRTPLHYAILGGHTAAIEHILPRTSTKTRYALTSDLLPGSTKQLTCLDYAIIAGQPEAFAYFQHLKMPFKLGRKEELYTYLEASGILRSSLTARASQKDRLKIGFQDLLFCGINSTWAGLSAASHFLGKQTDATDWTGWSLDRLRTGTVKLRDFSSGANEFFGLGKIFQALPPNIAQAVNTYRNLSFLYTMVQLGGSLIGIDAYLPKWTGAIDFVKTNITPIDDYYPNVGYSALRVYAAVKPVWDKMPLYRAEFWSRPGDVMKNVALDAFNITTQALMSYYAIPAPATSKP